MTRPDESDESFPQCPAAPTHPPHGPRSGPGPARVALAGLLAAAALVLLFEHRVHVLGVLPWLLVLACPLMHLFGHGTHGAHARHPRQRDAAGHAAAAEHETGSIPDEVRGWRAPSPWARPPGPLAGRDTRTLEEMPAEAPRPLRPWRLP